MEHKLNLKLVKGPIRSLEKAKSKIPINQNIGGIAAGTAFAGVLAESSSLLTSAPILVMAGKAKDGITFTGGIEEHSLLGQFTTVRFKENDELIAVISDSPMDGRYQVYAIVDPKSGLLYMIYEMGRSVKRAIKLLLCKPITLLLFVEVGCQYCSCFSIFLISITLGILFSLCYLGSL